MSGSSVVVIEVSSSGRTRKGGQHIHYMICLFYMKRKRVEFNHAAAKARVVREEEEASGPERDAYDLSTPLWAKYYQQVRKSIRFPRYYKRTLNW